jgi:hypothetical protein
MIERRPWPNFGVSPWAEDPEPPSVLEVARAYPERAFGSMLIGVVLGLFLTGFLAWVVGLLRGAPVTSLTAGYIVWAALAAGLWWVDMYGDIHGWSTSGLGE